MNDPLPGPPLRIAVLGDFEGPHTRSWLRVFVARGHDVHAISYYQPRAELPGVSLHVLSGQAGRRADGQTSTRTGAGRMRELIPPNLMRHVHAWRYRRAGLRALLDELHPDVFHAHYAVEHGFYGAVGYHPYVVSAWGSDLLVESRKLLGKRIAQHALNAADLVTGNDASLVKRAIELGVAPEKTALVHLGIERLFLEAGEHSVNLRAIDTEPLWVTSTRALEPLYNPIDVAVAFLRIKDRLRHPTDLIVAGDGRLRGLFEEMTRQAPLRDRLRALGHLDQTVLAETLARSQVYVSVPSSDSLALSNLEAMAAGAFPIVSDLPSVDGWIEHGVNGLRVPPRNVDALAGAIQQALNDPDLRRRAALHNRALVEARGLREPNMLLMERHYYRLAGHPIEERGAI